MGAMKAIATDIQELQMAAAELDEEEFIEYIQATGWVSPTEVEIRARQAPILPTAVDFSSESASQNHRAA